MLIIVISVEHLVGGVSGGGGLVPRGLPQPPLQQHHNNALQPASDEYVLTSKRQAVVERLRRRLDTYRRRQSECVPRFDQSFTGACEQQNLETTALQKRFLENKAKRVVKKSSQSPAERKPETSTINGNLHSSVHVQQKFNSSDYEPAPKISCAGARPGGGDGMLKTFSVEIVQQLEFTTSSADSQPQQISTNVTVKALTNSQSQSNVEKTECTTPGTANTLSPHPPPQSPLECKRECKSELPDDEFVGLDECAAALERDTAGSFAGFPDFIGEDNTDEIIASAAFADLITELHEDPELMKDFLDCGRQQENETKIELSPAAQTLKQMAEQHQHKNHTDWRYRPYRPRAPLDQIHATQNQQMHINQPHQNIQVSAGQHMQVNGDMRGGHITAQQGMFANFAQHNPLGGTGTNVCESYSMSQSQCINFQPGIRPRPPAQQQPSGPLAAAGVLREHQAKMLLHQQQQMLRHQQLQHQRPPPPEYKAAAAAQSYRRPQKPAYDWRMYSTHHQAGSFNMGGMGVAGNVNSGGMTTNSLTAMQQQQLQQHQLQQARIQQQQQQQMLHQQQRAQNQQHQMSGMPQISMQQSQMMNVHGQIPNIHLSQAQSMTMQQVVPNHTPSSTTSSQHQNASNNQTQSNQNNSTFNSFTNNDFNFDFLDSMQPNDDLLTNLDNSFLSDIF